MPRYIIETDNEQDHRHYLAGPLALSGLWNFGEMLIQKCKHGDEAPLDWSVIRELFYEQFGDILADYE